MANIPPTQPDPNPPPAWDREAARARYRKMMRSWPMLTMYALLALVLLFSFAWAGAAVFASSVEALPGHDITVPTQSCITCHTTAAAANNAPPMNHFAAPSCGFCHRQSAPPVEQNQGWARTPTY